VLAVFIVFLTGVMLLNPRLPPVASHFGKPLADVGLLKSVAEPTLDLNLEPVQRTTSMASSISTRLVRPHVRFL
jgi:hypothetical protein